MPRAAFSQIVNRSMSEVLTRSLATSFSTILAVGSLLVFGGPTLQDFAFAMLVGIASGTYSSIFIASPVLTAWKEREPGFVRRRLRIAQTEGTVPAFADDVAMAELSADDETETEIAAVAGQPETQPQAGAVATVERTGDGNGADPTSNADSAMPNARRVARPAASTEGSVSRWHCSSGSRWESPSGTSPSSSPITSGRASSALFSAPWSEPCSSASS
jgi:SecD/SecF fusion protein